MPHPTTPQQSYLRRNSTYTEKKKKTKVNNSEVVNLPHQRVKPPCTTMSTVFNIIEALLTVSVFDERCFISSRIFSQTGIYRVFSLLQSFISPEGNYIEIE